MFDPCNSVYRTEGYPWPSTLATLLQGHNLAGSDVRKNSALLAQSPQTLLQIGKSQTLVLSLVAAKCPCLQVYSVHAPIPPANSVYRSLSANSVYRSLSAKRRITTCEFGARSLSFVSVYRYSSSLL